MNCPPTRFAFHFKAFPNQRKTQSHTYFIAHDIIVSHSIVQPDPLSLSPARYDLEKRVSKTLAHNDIPIHKPPNHFFSSWFPKKPKKPDFIAFIPSSSAALIIAASSFSHFSPFSLISFSSASYALVAFSLATSCNILP